VAQEKEIYILIANWSGDAFWIDAREGLEEVGKLLGVETRFTGPLDSDLTKQIADIDTAIAIGVKGIIIPPVDPEALVPAINRAVEAGIPVVTFLNDSPNSKRLLFVTTPVRESTHYGGEYLANLLGRKGKVGISYGSAGEWEQEERAAGYIDIINKYPEMEFVAMVEDQYDYGVGLSNVKSMLIAHPDLDAIVGVNATSGAAIGGALRELGYKPGEVKVIAYDKNEDVLDFIKEDWIQASLVQRTFIQAVLAVEILYWYNHGLLYPKKMQWKEHGVSPLPEVMDTGVFLCTKENADAFYRR